MILESVQNAWNVDPEGERGSIKSRQQLEAEINQYYKDNIPGGGLSLTDRPVFSTEEIKQRMDERLPSDYIGNEGKYMLMMRGYSKKQAEENAEIMDYYAATRGRKTAMETLNPKLVEQLQAEPDLPNAIKDITAIKKNDAGKTIPTYSLYDLVERNPGIDESILKQKAMPVYRESAFKFIGDFMDREYNGKPIKKGLKNAYLGQDKNIENEGLQGIKETSVFKEMRDQLELSYQGFFTPAEIETLT
jgi:hypothetical protein